MKRNIITLLITVFAMLQATAQTYDNLWKQADIIAQKDQPKSEIGVMKKIISKATAAYPPTDCRGHQYKRWWR